MNKSLLLALSALVPFSMADEVKLKDGTVYKDCTVEVETPESISVMVVVSGGIKESKTIKRELIETITKASPAELAAAKIDKNYAKPEIMSAKELEAAQKELDAVIKKNPQGEVHDAAVKARATIVVLLEEKKLVEEAKAVQEAKEAAEVTVRTKYDHEAGKLLKRFKALNTARKPYQAMAVYDRLRQNYPGSAALAEAYPDAVRISAQVNRTLDVMIAAKEKSLEKERQMLSREEEKRRANAKLTQEQRSALLDAFQKKQVALRERENQLTEVHRAHRKKVRERGDRWFEPTAGSLEAMRDIKLVASTDAERLKNQEKEMSAKIGCKVEIKKILVRNIEKAAAKIEDASLLTSQWDEIINDPEIEIVIELMGGINPAKEYILSALKAGKHVVSANKDLIAVHGHELLDAAHESKVDFLFEAAVAGGIPIIRPLKQCLAGNHMTEVMGIVNGTTNFILTKMTQEGMEFKDALALATELGYAEADPTADIEGLDAGRKLSLIHI